MRFTINVDIFCCRSTTEVAEGAGAEEEPVTKRIRTAEVG